MKTISTKVFILSILMLCGNILLAQQRVITGNVSDENGVALPGVAILGKNTKIGTTTDGKGYYSISVPSSVNILVYSFVGMKTMEQTIGTRSTINVSLNSDSRDIEEVVVIGYGTARKTDITTSIASVNQKELKNLPVAGIDQALQGRVAGVTVNSNGGQPGGGVSVRVRGITSVNGNEPLYVIDGVPIAAQSNTLDQSFLGGGNGQTAQSVLASINPADIASIDILKDASAQAIYGSRAANGVILINTKKGTSGEGKIVYDTYVGVQEIPRKLKIMNLRQNAMYQNSVLADINAVTNGNQLPIAEFADPSILGNGTDWQDEIYQRGSIQSHQLSFSGGQGKTNYYFSGGYFTQLGTLIETDFKRYSLRANIDHQVKNWLKTGFSVNLARSNQKIGLSDGFDAVTSTVLYNSPASPVTDVFGNYIGQSRIGGTPFGNPSNPVALAKSRDIRNTTSKAFGALYAELQFMQGLTLRSEFNYDFNLSSDKAYQPLVRNDSAKVDIITPSRLREQRTNSLFWALKNYLNFNKSFGKHSLGITLGHEAQSSTYDYVNASREKLTLNLPSLAAGLAGNNSNEQIGAGAGVWSMESFFGRVNYAFNDRYAISATLRADGSSSFGPKSRWGYFPAVSASWTITNEEFAKNISNLSYLKLRVGAGTVGNQNVGANNAYTSNITLYGDSPFGNGNAPYNVANPALSWESVRTFNGGFDATLLKNLELTVDLYRKVTTNMLLPTQLGNYSGLGTDYGDIQTPIANNGQITNTGIDISLTTRIIEGKDLSWKTGVIFSHYKNNLDFLNTPEATILGQYDEYGDKPIVTLSQQGQPVGTFYGYVTDGLFTSLEQLNNGTKWGLDVAPDKLWLGDIRFKDLNGDGKIDEKDVTVIGNPNPTFTYGMTNTVKYKNFDLSVFLQGSYGAKIFNYARRQTEAMNSLYSNQLETVMNRYTATNTNTNMPRFNQWHDGNRRISDRYIEDGSYLRIQNVSLGYNIPKSILSKIKVSNARIYVSGQNLYTFTKYTGYDPELGANNNRVTLMNIDNGHYPNPRSFTLGANIEF
ncbi:MAG: TonB-dependent receptor [Arcicella sp.]|jgi:TonB-linked SusC/RagA family outer membrane protein|nr:TonB-dependent receptor [Arcicella sp.]